MATKTPGTTVSSAVAELAAAHTAHAFGVMGEGNAFFLDAAEWLGLPLTPVRHESGAVAAADAFYRASGRIAVATTTYGAGFTNALTALTEAVKARIPLLFVTGGRGEVAKTWDIDELAILSSLDIPAFVASPDDAASATHSALLTALSTSRPAAVVIPEDVASLPAANVPSAYSERLRPAIPPVSAAIADDVARLLREARHPLILGGRGVWVARAGELYIQLAKPGSTDGLVC